MEGVKEAPKKEEREHPKIHTLVRAINQFATEKAKLSGLGTPNTHILAHFYVRIKGITLFTEGGNYDWEKVYGDMYNMVSAFEAYFLSETCVECGEECHTGRACQEFIYVFEEIPQVCSPNQYQLLTATRILCDDCVLRFVQRDSLESESILEPCIMTLPIFAFAFAMQDVLTDLFQTIQKPIPFQFHIRHDKESLKEIRAFGSGRAFQRRCKFKCQNCGEDTLPYDSELTHPVSITITQKPHAKTDKTDFVSLYRHFCSIRCFQNSLSKFANSRIRGNYEAEGDDNFMSDVIESIKKVNIYKALHEKYDIRETTCASGSDCISPGEEHAKNCTKFCSACSIKAYCSSECQAKDWKRGHKEECRVFKTLWTDQVVKPLIKGSYYFGREIPMIYYPNISYE